MPSSKTASWLCALAIGATSLTWPAMSSAQSGYASATSPDAYLQAANAVSTSIDRYEMASVWNAASPVMKTSIPEETFIGNVAQRRALLGTIRNRDWVSIMRVPVATADGALPPGQYVSVRFATTGTNGRTMEEVISFRQDNDSQWRLVGYTLN